MRDVMLCVCARVGSCVQNCVVVELDHLLWDAVYFPRWIGCSGTRMALLHGCVCGAFLTLLAVPDVAGLPCLAGLHTLGVVALRVRVVVGLVSVAVLIRDPGRESGILLFNVLNVKLYLYVPCHTRVQNDVHLSLLTVIAVLPVTWERRSERTSRRQRSFVAQISE